MTETNVRSGLDVVATTRRDVLRGKRIATIANHTAVTQDLASIYDVLASRDDLEFVFLYSAFHGIRGDHQDSEEGYHIDKKTGLPVYPAALLRKDEGVREIEQHNVDAIVFDIQSAGSKYFGYKNVICSAEEIAAKTGIEVILLDRPNPLGGLITEGEVEEAYRPRVGWYQVPNIHGMTYGELATMFNQEHGVNCNLTVVKMEGWRRSMWYNDTGMLWPMLSCNLPTITSCLAFAGTCLFEGCNISEGRGTTRPFEIVGAPWLVAKELVQKMNDLALPGVKFGEAYFIPTPNPIPRFSKFAGERCQGVRMYITDREAFQPVRATIHLLEETMRADLDRFKWLELGNQPDRYYMDWLAGSDDVRTKLEAGEPADEIVEAWTSALSNYRKERRRYFLYD
jgi:uncharacterized protein YbbC (DUF1343 family)